MVIPFSNTKLRVPPGFQSLLVGLSTEILRSQPRNIHDFAASYFEKLLQRRVRFFYFFFCEIILNNRLFSKYQLEAKQLI
ncbi:unnamed protein product [Rotaria sordida]|uniref:RIIa domain-containing protein n=2 Tax=Rotaria sordida TaxID=392033 RepID=A0A815M554_9BILA|nr:unnamed protein product [Rotaria sordida]CAF1414625.1 unnamed protein product [Rotaria sordida]CAF1424837.1 unnamed protein product [Rotaria sordida]